MDQVQAYDSEKDQANKRYYQAVSRA